MTTSAEAPVPDSQLDAYALLSTPTLQITDAQALLIIEDLRKRRFISLSTGKPDKVAKPKEAKPKTDAAQKAANTKAMLQNIDWKL